MKFKFQKMQGAGNDFLFLDAMKGDEPTLYPSEIIHVCDRNYGIGADGLVILRPGEEGHSRWTYFNCDGQEAEMCGNAARCAIRYLKEHHFPDEDVISLETRAGLLKGKLIEEDRVEITLLPQSHTSFPYEDKYLRVGEEMINARCITVGVPHAVIEVDNIETYPINRVGAALVRHSAFENGTNVTFFQRQVGNRIRATTYERGVEVETLACGTGAGAAAIIFSELYMQPFPVSVVMPGGELEVDLSPMSRKLLLRGPAQYVMQVELGALNRRFEKPRRYGEGNK